MSSGLQIYQASDVVAAGLSSGCANAFAATLSCPDILVDPDSSYTWAGLTPTNITNLCNTACSDSIETYRENVVSACGNETYVDPAIEGANATMLVYGTGTTYDILNMGDITANPVAFIDYWILNYRLNCMNDSSTPPVNCYLKSHSNSSDTTGIGSDFPPCDTCALGAMYEQLQYPQNYNEDAVSTFASLTSSCGATTYPAISSPTPIFFNNNASDVYNGTQAACSGTLVAPGSTPCDEFAAQNSVGTAQMLILNNLAAGCLDWPGNLSSICIEDTCTTYQVGANDTCVSVAQANNITLTQFLSWNPEIDPLCLNFDQQIGHIVCVNNPLGYVVPSATISGQPTTGPTTAAAVPTNAESGSNTNCGRWYNVNAGDYCALVCNKQSITLHDFYFLNPEINANCTNLILDESYCVAAVGDISTYPGYNGASAVATATVNPTTGIAVTSLPTATMPTYNITNSTETQYPLANNSISTCFEMFDNDWGNINCEDAASNFGVSVSSLLLWNPSLGNWTDPPSPCTLQNETRYCGSFYNQSLAAPVNPFPLAPIPSTAGPNSTADCYDWWTVDDGDTCTSICNSTDISFSDFYAWNPEIGADCSNLWLYSSYCVYGPGGANSSFYTSSAAPTATASSASTTVTGTTQVSGAPGPTQSGIASNCDKYYVVKKGDNCDGISAAFDITFATFLDLNPAVQSDCSMLWIGEAYCVDAPGISHTTPSPTSSAPTSTGSALPGPTQSGIVSDCDKYAESESGDGCYSFAQRNNITLTELYDWNAALEGNCTDFYADYAYCIGVSS